MMSDRQKLSVSKIQVSHKSATRWQERRRLTCLFWILIAVVIAIGLAFLPRNQDSPALEIKQNINLRGMLLNEPGIDLSHSFWQYPAKGNDFMTVASTFPRLKETLIHD